MNGRDFLLVHAGLGNYSPGKEMDEYSLKELVWDRADYETQYFDDVYVVTGHTPTQFIQGNPKPGYIYRKNNHIAIDCQCYAPGEGWRRSALTPGKNSIPRQMAAEIG